MSTILLDPVSQQIRDANQVFPFHYTGQPFQANLRISLPIFTGFSRYNVQAIMNSLRWGLDNKIYGAAAGNGGTVHHVEGTLRVPSAPDNEQKDGTGTVPAASGDGTRRVPTTLDCRRATTAARRAFSRSSYG